MTAVQSRSTRRKRSDGLSVIVPVAVRASTLAALVVLLLQYGLGIAANLYATLPASDHGKSIFPAFAAAITTGPDIVIAHAVLGTLLLIGAVTVLIRTLRTHSPLLIAVAALALAAIIAAWLSGARSVGATTNGASLAMAIATAVAILAYILILFLAAAPAARREGAH
jgi:hypothetical protein